MPASRGSSAPRSRRPDLALGRSDRERPTVTRSSTPPQPDDRGQVVNLLRAATPARVIELHAMNDHVACGAGRPATGASRRSPSAVAPERSGARELSGFLSGLRLQLDLSCRGSTGEWRNRQPTGSADVGDECIEDPGSLFERNSARTITSTLASAVVRAQRELTRPPSESSGTRSERFVMTWSTGSPSERITGAWLPGEP
jgi:hypothetical protein